MTPEPAISVTGLTMRYGDVDVLHGIDLDVEQGEIFCFLGPNGAGKTTTVEILEGYRRRSGGTVCVLGTDPAAADAAWRGRVGVVLQDCTPEAELTVRETLRMYAGFHDHPLPIDEVLDTVGLRDRAGVRNARLSGGQRRRLDVALALVGDPDLVFLDEPTTGFDPEARRGAWEAIRTLRTLGKTVVLTTHDLVEAETLADRIAVLVDGRIAATGTPATIGRRGRQKTEVRIVTADRRLRTALPEALARAASDDGRTIVLETYAPIAVLHELTTLLLDLQVTDAALEVHPPTLEDVYLDLVGANRRGGTMTTVALTPTTLAPVTPATGAPSALARLRHQVRYDLLVLTRNREARFFTFALPVLMLVLFVAIFGNQTFELGGVTLPGATYYVSTQLVFGIVDGAMMTTAVAIVGARELGILKRRRATPQPAWVVVVSRGVVGVLSALAMSGLLLGVSAVAYGTRIPLVALPVLGLAIVAGSFSFCALGFAMSTVIRNAESATPVVMGITLPLFFVSGVFVPWFLVPPWLQSVAGLFPVRHLAALTMQAMAGAPASRGIGALLVDLAVVTGWGVLATIVAARRFRWSPRA